MGTEIQVNKNCSKERPSFSLMQKNLLKNYVIRNGSNFVISGFFVIYGSYLKFVNAFLEKLSVFFGFRQFTCCAHNVNQKKNYLR